MTGEPAIRDIILLEVVTARPWTDPIDLHDLVAAVVVFEPEVTFCPTSSALSS